MNNYAMSDKNYFAYCNAWAICYAVKTSFLDTIIFDSAIRAGIVFG